MARDHARIYVDIWADPDFRALPERAQRMYFVALSQPRLNYCGVLDYMPSRLAKFAADSSTRAVAAAVSILEARGFAVHDENTSELLLRSFVRHDGLLASPNMAKAMVKDYWAVLSEDIQKAVLAELSRAYEADASLKGWPGVADASPELFAMVCGKGSLKGYTGGSEK
jgi:hypothetical protein